MKSLFLLIKDVGPWRSLMFKMRPNCKMELWTPLKGVDVLMDWYVQFYVKNSQLFFVVQHIFRGFPGGSGWESACRCKGHGFEPWSGRIPHAAEQLGPWATIAEPACLEPVLRNQRGRDSERPAHSYEEWPPLATTGESPRTETKTQHSHKLIN